MPYDKPHSPIKFLLFSLLILSLTLGVGAQETTETSAPAEGYEAIPVEVANHAEDWPLANQDYSNTRAATTSNINSDTVDELEVAWSFPIPGRALYGAAASAPVISAGVVYFQDLESNVFAIDLLSGEVLWEQMYENVVVGPNGPGIGYEKVYVISSVNSFAALDIETGSEVWSVSTGERAAGAFQPYAYGGFVYYGTRAGDIQNSESRGYAGGASGYIMALNPDTGETVWEFQTVEEGFWGNPEVNSGGGVWFPPAIDTQTQLTFWGTGNPAPFPGTFDYPNASSREEENLYTNSLLALQYDSGELFWYNHVNPNDLFDLDFQLSPMLATITLEGQQREVVIGSGKLGEVVTVDRETGETIWRTEVGIHQNDNLTEIPAGETVTVYPGTLGGVETPMAYADGVVFVPVLNLPTEHSPTGFDAETGTEALENLSTPAGQGTSEVVALDAATGQILWSHEFDNDMYGGATVVGDLVFVATFNGMIYALNRASGEIEWSYQASGGINAWPAVADNTIVWPIGAGESPELLALRLPFDEEADEPVGEAATSEITPDATEPEATAEMTAETTAESTQEMTPETTEPAPTATPSAEDGEASAPEPQNVGDPQQGQQLFNNLEGEQACSECHVVRGGGGGIGPSLADLPAEAGNRVEGLSAEEYTRQSILHPNEYILEGYADGVMPTTYSEILSEQQVNDLVAYLLSL